MPAYDRIVRLTGPAVQRTVAVDGGYGRSVWPAGSRQGVPNPNATEALTIEYLTDRYDVAADGETVRDAQIPYSVIRAPGLNPRPEDAEFDIAWGGVNGFGNILDISAAALSWKGVLLGRPAGATSFLPVVASDADAHIGDAEFYVYTSTTDQRQTERAVTWPVTQISSWRHGLLDMRFGGDGVDVTDFRDGEIRANSPLTMAGWGWRVRLSYTQSLQRYWARLEDASGVSLSVGSGAQSDVEESRSYVLRWAPRDQIDVLSQLVDDENNVFTVTERSDMDTRRTMRLRCSRTITPSV